MLTLKEKLYLLLTYTQDKKHSFRYFVEYTFKYPYYVLNDNNLREAITLYCDKYELCENCLNKDYCNCKG